MILFTQLNNFNYLYKITNKSVDIYHAKNRVSKLLQKSHPDYTSALKSLTQIFGHLKIPQPDCEFKSQADFKTALVDWKNKFSTAHNLGTNLEKVLNLANAMEGKKISKTQGTILLKNFNYKCKRKPNSKQTN